jgi:hypothetical protein
MTEHFGQALSALGRAVYAGDARATPVQLWAIVGASIALLTGWIGLAISALHRRRTDSRAPGLSCSAFRLQTSSSAQIDSDAE